MLGLISPPLPGGSIGRAGLLDTEALPSALGKVGDELVEGDALLGRFDPPFGVEGVRVRVNRLIRMDEIRRLTDRSLCRMSATRIRFGARNRDRLLTPGGMR